VREHALIGARPGKPSAVQPLAQNATARL